MQSFFSGRKTMTCRGKLLDFSSPIVMGILNLSSDSFYKSNRFWFKPSVTKRAKAIIDQGGLIIDVGACSSRPGAELITEERELALVTKALKKIRKQLPDAIISVDTFRAKVARVAVNEFEVNMINDISAGELDENMLPTVAQLKVPYVLMHMQGTPANMQNNPKYTDVVQEIFRFFADKVHTLNKLGVNDIILDPGFGFGKTLEHNYTILNNLEAFRIFDLPIMAGLSRKSMIYKPLNITPRHALNGTSIVNTLALSHGASILRVHDVAPAVEAINIMKLTQAQPSIE